MRINDQIMKNISLQESTSVALSPQWFLASPNLWFCSSYRRANRQSNAMQKTFLAEKTSPPPTSASHWLNWRSPRACPPGPAGTSTLLPMPALLTIRTCPTVSDQVIRSRRGPATSPRARPARTASRNTNRSRQPALRPETGVIAAAPCGKTNHPPKTRTLDTLESERPIVFHPKASAAIRPFARAVRNRLGMAPYRPRPVGAAVAGRKRITSSRKRRNPWRKPSACTSPQRRDRKSGTLASTRFGRSPKRVAHPRPSGRA